MIADDVLIGRVAVPWRLRGERHLDHHVRVVALLDLVGVRTDLHALRLVDTSQSITLTASLGPLTKASARVHITWMAFEKYFCALSGRARTRRHGCRWPQISATMATGSRTRGAEISVGQGRAAAAIKEQCAASTEGRNHWRLGPLQAGVAF